LKEDQHAGRGGTAARVRGRACLRTSNAYNFLDPGSPEHSKSEKPTGTSNQALFLFNELATTVSTIRNLSPHEYYFSLNRNKIEKTLGKATKNL
jgi:hypothetical protein